MTGGRHHFWFLPNLTADVGFIDSFRPLYTHEYKGPKANDKKGSDKTVKDSGAQKAQKSDSDEKSDSEKKDDDDEEEEEAGRKEADKEGPEDRHSDTDSDRREDEGSQHSNGNDFEMITREELEQHTEEEDEEDDGEEEEEEEEEETEVRKEGGRSETEPQTAET